MIFVLKVVSSSSINEPEIEYFTRPCLRAIRTFISFDDGLEKCRFKEEFTFRHYGRVYVTKTFRNFIQLSLYMLNTSWRTLTTSIHGSTV